MLFRSWSATSPAERAEWLMKIHAGLEARTDEIASTIAREVGMPLMLANIIQAGLPKANFAIAAQLLGSYQFEQQITDLVPFLDENWKAGVSPKTGNPVYERPVVLVVYREDHKFLLDPIIPKPGGTVANYDLVIASQPYRARASLEFKAKRVIAPLARALGPGGRLIAIHSHGNDPGHEIVQKVWPGDNPFIHDRHQIMKAVKHELGIAARDLNFNVYADNRSLFRYDMNTLPSEITGSSAIGTSTLFAAWNAAIYVAQVEDHRVAEAAADGRYLEATKEVLQKHGALWFYDESYVISRRRE